jgi:HK97 family phage major capsid protein
VSIGFRSLEHAYIEGTGGIRFIATEILELSLVTVPANASATIQSIKSLDQQQRAASGQSVLPVVRVTAPADAGHRKHIPNPKPQEGNMKTIKEQLESLQATREQKHARMSAITDKTLGEGRTKDAAEREEFDTLNDEIKALRVMESLNVEKAKPVDQRPTPAAAAANREGVTLKTSEKLEPGIAFARYAMCLVKAKGDHGIAFRLAEKNYPLTEAVVRVLKAQAEGADLAEMMKVKATVDAATFNGDFIDYLRPRTLIGQAQFRRVPFNVRIGSQTSGGSANWVGQGKAKPLTKFDFAATTIPFTKIAAISVLTQELVRFSDPSAEALVRDSLADAVIARVDSDLFDPDVAAVANVNPAGLLNGIAAVAGPASTDPDDIRTALLGLWAAWDSTNLGSRPAYYTTPAVARLLAFTRDALGNVAFPGVTATGGSLDGIPLRVSQYLAHNGGSGGAPFILVDEAEVYLADDGNVTLDASREASLEMSDAPAHNSTTPTAAQLVSMFQTNSIALRAERFIWWGLRRSGAINWIDGFPTR